MGTGEVAEPLRARDLAGAVLVGMILRCATVGRQVVGGDELHAVRAALSMPLSEILVTFRETDHSIPLAALFRVALDLGVQLGEIELRLPALVASLALLLLAPLWAAPLVGARAAKYWAFALAISPLLVMYGRMVRSYSPVLALSTLALLAFIRFWRDGDRRFGAFYAVAGALSIWFHVGSGPIVCAPLVVAAALLALRGSTTSGSSSPQPPHSLRSWREWSGLVGALGVLGAALLFPARETLRGLIEAKSGAAGASLAVVAEAAQLHAGTAGALAAVVVACVVCAGGWRLWRSDRGARVVAAFAVGLPLLHILGLGLLAPKLDSPILAARATLVVLPWLALLAAVAAAGFHGAGWRRSVPGLMALAALALGPFVEPGYWRSAFQLHDDYIAFTRPRPSFAPGQLPALYGELDEDGDLVELPWHPFWGFGHAVPAYQEVHGRGVLVSNAQRYGRDPRMQWRRHVALDPDSLLASGARYALVHLDSSREEARARRAMGPLATVREQPRQWNLLRREGLRARLSLASAWGPPDLEDAEIAVWDLDRLRPQTR